MAAAALAVAPLDILLVEDDPADAALAEDVLTAHDRPTRLNRVGDGVQALAYLRRTAPYAAVTEPDLVLLDLNMPRMDGRELLTIIKTDPALAHIPVVVLTTSAAHQDILDAYQHHANAYVTKPLEFDDFHRALTKIQDFFGTIAELPPRG